MKLLSFLSLAVAVGASTTNSFHRDLQGDVEPLPRPVPVPADDASAYRAGVAERISAFTHALRDGLETRHTAKQVELPPAPQHPYRPAVMGPLNKMHKLPRQLGEQFRERQHGSRIPPHAQTWQTPKMAPKMKPAPHTAHSQRIASWASASEPGYSGPPPPPPPSPAVEQVQDACYEDYQYYCTFHTLPLIQDIPEVEEVIPCFLRGSVTVTTVLVSNVDDDDKFDDDDDYWTFNDENFLQQAPMKSSSSSSSSSGSWMSAAIPLGYGESGDACLYDNYDMLSSECQSAIEDYNETSSSSAHHYLIPALLLVILVLSLLACRLRRMRQRYEPMHAIMTALRNNPELKSRVEAEAGVQIPQAPASRPPLYLCVIRVVAAFVLSFIMVHVAVNIALNKTPTDGSNTLAMFTFLGWFLLVLLVEVSAVCAVKYCCKQCYKCCCSDSAPATSSPTLRSRVLAYVRRQSPPTGYAPLSEDETEMPQLSTNTSSGPPYCVVLAHGTEPTAPAYKPYSTSTANATPTIVSAHSLSNVTII